jgi:ATP-dependent exoDNAse (exonuclease V) beta subunit
MPEYEPTPEQARILGHDIGRNARVLAGPGTGKSATLVALVDELMEREEPPRLSLLTFTRAATGELAKKVSDRPAAATLLLTMRSKRQLVATGGNSSGLWEPSFGRGNLPPVATGCDHGAP